MATQSITVGTRPRRACALDSLCQGFLAERRAMFLAAAIPFVVVGTLTFANSSDDPLITLRYASNLVHHGAPVFNLGERVEGYTSPLHLILAAIVLLTPGGLALFKLKLLSLLFAAATLWQTARLSQAASLPRWARLSVMVAVAGSWNFVLSAGNGLETSMVAFLATGAAAALATSNSTGRWRAVAIWTAFLALSRPDAVLVIGLLAVSSVTAPGPDPRWRRLRWLVGPVASLGALLLFRMAYYGDVLPNTFYAKQLAPGKAAVSGFAYLLSSQPLSLLGFLVLVLQCWLISVGLLRFLRARPALRYALAVLIAQLVFIFVSGGDWMKGERFLVPAIPAGMVLAFAGLEALLGSPRESGILARHPAATLTTVLAVLVAPVSGAYVDPAWGITRGLTDTGLIAVGNYSLTPIWVTAVGLADCLNPGQSVAYSEAGLFGYAHPTLKLIDTRGLTTPAIARTAPSADRHPWGVVDPDWFRSNSSVGRVLVKDRPAMIISFDATPGDEPGRSILDGQYRRLTVIPEPTADRTLRAYLRHGVACPGPYRG